MNKCYKCNHSIHIIDNTINNEITCQQCNTNYKYQSFQKLFPLKDILSIITYSESNFKIMLMEDKNDKIHNVRIFQDTQELCSINLS